MCTLYNRPPHLYGPLLGPQVHLCFIYRVFNPYLTPFKWGCLQHKEKGDRPGLPSSFTFAFVCPFALVASVPEYTRRLN